MLRVRTHNLVALDVLQIVHEDALAEHVDERLNIRRHLVLVVGLDQLAEVVVGEGRHEELDVELISIHQKTLD